MPSLEHRGSLLLALALVLVALACLVFQLRLPGELVAESDYRAVAQVLEREGQTGDCVLLYPWWAERARGFVPARFQVVGYQGSDSDPLEQCPRVWLLAQPRLPRSQLGDLMKVFSEQRSELLPPREFGNLRLGLYRNGRFRPTRFSLADSLAQAQVYLESPSGQRRNCEWVGQGYRCPNGSAVQVEWHEVRFQPRRCVRFFPPGGQERVVAELAGVGAADALVVQGGLIWDRGYAKDPRLSVTQVSAQVNGAASAQLAIAPGEEGLHRGEGAAVPAGATVKLSAQADNPQNRELCVELYGYGASGG